MTETLPETSKTKKEFTEEETKVIRFIGGYTAAWIVFLILFAIVTRMSLHTLDNLTKLIIYVSCSGGLGSLTLSMYSYSDHLGKGDFDLSFFWWYILRPFIGIIYGCFVFFFVVGGLMTLSGVSPETIIENLFNAKTIMFYCALGFLAGYAEHAFSVQLKELAEAIFKVPPKNGNGSSGTSVVTPTDNQDPTKPT